MTNLRNFLYSHRRDLILLTLLFATALAIRSYFMQFYIVISADGVGYAEIGRSLFKAGGLATATHFPPFYPFLIAIFNLFLGDVELAGRVVSIIMGSLMVVPLYLLGNRFFDRRVALLACLLAITWGPLRDLSCEVMSQATYITLLLTAIYLFDRAVTRRSVVAAVSTGVIMGFAYLTRPEAFIVFAVASPFAVAYILTEGGSRRDAAAILIPGWLAFWALAFPYVLLLHNVTGIWQLTAKTGPTLWVGLGAYLGKFDVYRELDFKSIGFLDVIRNYPGFIPYNVRNNLHTVATELLPKYLWALACVGFIAGGWSRRKLIEKLFLLSSFAPLLLIIVFFLAGSGYTQLSLPILFLWIGQGAVSTETLLSKLLPVGLKPILQRNLLSTVLFGALSLSSLIAQIPRDAGKPYTLEQDEGRYDQKRIGLLLRQYLPQGSRIMTRSGRISFYSEFPTVMMPQSDLTAMYAYGRENKIRFLIVDGMLEQLRPQFEPLFKPLKIGAEKIFLYASQDSYTPIAGLRLYMLYKDTESLGVAVYEFID